MMKRLMAGVAAVLAIAAAAPVVMADSVVVEDPVEGYDAEIYEASHAHMPPRRWGLLRHDIETTFESVVGGPAELRLRLIGAEQARRRTIVADANLEGPLRGLVLDERGRLLGHAFVWRPGEATLRIEFARALLDGARAYRWSARLHQPCDDTGEAEPSCVPQWDRVPNEGTIRHRID